MNRTIISAMSLNLVESKLALAGTKGMTEIFAVWSQSSVSRFYYWWVALSAKHQCVLWISYLSCLAEERIGVLDYSYSVRIRLHMLQSELHTVHLQILLYLGCRAVLLYGNYVVLMPISSLGAWSPTCIQVAVGWWAHFHKTNIGIMWLHCYFRNSGI